MILALLALSLSLFLALFLTPVARRLALRIGLVDRPDGGRKTQSKPIPVAGGLVLLVSVLLALTVLWLLPMWQDLEFDPVLLRLLPACVAICALGVADDFGRLRGRHKLAGQMAIVAFVIWSGVEVRQVSCFGWDLELGLMTVPFTAFLLLGAINSLNLIDGMDGLLSTVGAIICLTLGAMALLNGQWATTLVTLAMAGALLGFLRYNFPPATIYLGDAGSMLVGLVIGVLAIRSSLKGPAAIVVSAPVALLAVPIFDTVAAILRRSLTGRSIYTTDRGHLHYCLMRKGLGTRWTLLVISLFCLVTAGGTLASLALKNELCAVLSALGVIGVMVAGRIFGHAELSLLFKRLKGLGSSLANFPTPNGRGYEVHLQGNLDWGTLWYDLHQRFDELSLRSVQLDVNLPALHENYHASWHQPTADDASEAQMWRAEFPLKLHGRVFGRLSMAGRGSSAPEWQKIEILTRLSEEFAIANHLFNGVANGAANGVAHGVANGTSNGVTNGIILDTPHGITLPIRADFREAKPAAVGGA